MDFQRRAIRTGDSPFYSPIRASELRSTRAFLEETAPIAMTKYVSCSLQWQQQEHQQRYWRSEPISSATHWSSLWGMKFVFVSIMVPVFTGERPAQFAAGYSSGNPSM